MLLLIFTPGCIAACVGNVGEEFVFESFSFVCEVSAVFPLEGYSLEMKVELSSSTCLLCL